MRRLILEEANSSAALWSRRIAVLAVPVAGFGLAFGRFRYTDLNSALAVLGFAMFLAVLAIILAGFAFVNIWRTGAGGTRIALFGVFLSLCLLAWPGFLTVRSLQLPRINDISTDIDQPPSFSPNPAVVAARGGFMPAPMTRQLREQQPAAYPLVLPLVLDADAIEAFAAVQKVVKKLGWKELDLTAPIPGRADGLIEMSSRSLLMGIPYNIVIRLRPAGDSTRVDMRALTRFGAHDFGANAELIEKFNAALQAEMDAR